MLIFSNVARVGIIFHDIIIHKSDEDKRQKLMVSSDTMQLAQMYGTIRANDVDINVHIFVVYYTRK